MVSIAGMRNLKYVILLHKNNFKGIYAVLSRIWQCRKSRVFGANFLVKKAAGAASFAFCNYEFDDPTVQSSTRKKEKYRHR